MITTPIFYVNSVPHLGHLYSCLLADAHARYNKLLHPRNNKIIFSTGTDEHGLKVQQAAQTAGLQPSKFCDGISEKFRELFDKSDIEYSHYIRTSSELHKDTVTNVWNRLEHNGDLYKSEYQGWYSVQEEAFVPENSIENKDGQIVHSDTGQRLEWAKEENWMFKLTKYREQLSQWHSDQVPVTPGHHRSQVLRWINEELVDLSVSRPASRLFWGVPVPGDEDQTIYVWIDALVNYLTIANYPNMSVWPPTVQVLGKDILKFHSVYWPALLMSLELQLPKKLLVHGHWNVDNVKMSKSLGNVVDPNSLISKFSTDGVRYFLLREGVPASDCNFSEKSMIQILNLELADTLGNLLNRCSSSKVNKDQVIPQYPYPSDDKSALTQDIHDLMEKSSHIVRDAYDSFNFYQGIVQIMTLLRLVNQFVQEQQPWKLKNDEDKEKLKWILSTSFEVLRISGILLQPIVPNLATKLLDKMNIELEERQWKFAQPGLVSGERKLSETPTLLYQKLR